MPSITVKNIPDDLYDNLKSTAKAHHRSINSELIVCLKKVLLPTKVTPKQRIAEARTLRQRVKSKRLKAADIDTAKNHGRA
jgi:plasmid stability protein